MRRIYIIAAIALLAGVGAVGGLWRGHDAPRVAPDVAFSTLKGERITMQALRGRPALINFWASDCPSCLEEMPHLAGLHHRFSDDGLALVGVAMAYDPPNRVLELAERRRLPYPIALDLDGALALAFGNVSVIPTTFLIAPDGNIVRRYVGLPDMAQLRREIAVLLPVSR